MEGIGYEGSSYGYCMWYILGLLESVCVVVELGFWVFGYVC